MSSDGSQNCLVCGSGGMTFRSCNCDATHAYQPCFLCITHVSFLCDIDTAVNKNRGNYLPLEIEKDVWISMVDDDDGKVLSNNVKSSMDRIAEIIPGLQYTITYKGVVRVAKNTMYPGSRGVRGTAIITILGKSDGSSVKSASKS